MIRARKEEGVMADKRIKKAKALAKEAARAATSTVKDVVDKAADALDVDSKPTVSRKGSSKKRKTGGSSKTKTGAKKKAGTKSKTNTR
jgi:hypothetical protein